MLFYIYFRFVAAIDDLPVLPLALTSDSIRTSTVLLPDYGNMGSPIAVGFVFVFMYARRLKILGVVFIWYFVYVCISAV